MAWVRRLESGRWQGGYRDASGNRHTAGSWELRKDALAAVRAEEREILRGTWVPPELRNVKVADWSARWLAGAHSLKPKTVASYESLLGSRVLPTFGNSQLRAIPPSDVADWIGEMVKAGLSPSRIRQAHVVLRVMLDLAVRDGLLARNPATKAKLPRLEHKEAPFFTPDVVDALSAAVQAPYDFLVDLLGTLGLRWGEAAALRGRHVDSLRRRLVVEDSLAEVSGRFGFGKTKSHATRRVPVPASLLARFPAVGPDELLFRGPKGGPLRYRYFLIKVWHRRSKGSGCPR